MPDRVDRAIATTDLDLAQHRRWQLIRVLQWLLVATVVAGLGWLGLSCWRTCSSSAFDVLWWGLPAPTVLAVGGAWRLLGRAGRIGGGGARRRTTKARQSLRAAIAKVTGELVVDPVKAEQQRQSARLALERAWLATVSFVSKFRPLRSLRYPRACSTLQTPEFALGCTRCIHRWDAPWKRHPQISCRPHDPRSRPHPS